MNASSIVGVWKLVSFHMKDSDGNLTFPFGPDAVGYYMFTESGYGCVAPLEWEKVG